MTVSLGLDSRSERVILDIIHMSIPVRNTVRKWFSIVYAAPLFSPGLQLVGPIPFDSGFHTSNSVAMISRYSLSVKAYNKMKTCSFTHSLPRIIPPWKGRTQVTADPLKGRASLSMLGTPKLPISMEGRLIYIKIYIKIMVFDRR